MNALEGQTTWLNYSEAARRIGRSDRNIRRWNRDGMSMDWRVGADGQRERVVREDVLLAWFRDRLKASPAHYYRMRALARAEGLPEPERPASLDRARPKPTVRVSGAHSVAEHEEQTPAGVSPWKMIDPLETAKPMKGGPEYDELQRALRRTPAPCRDVDAFTEDRIDAATVDVLAGICATCPVLDVCRAYAERARPGGYWAGAKR